MPGSLVPIPFMAAPCWRPASRASIDKVMWAYQARQDRAWYWAMAWKGRTERDQRHVLDGPFLSAAGASIV